MGVYTPTLKRSKEFFWKELGAIRGLWNDPWCVGGDFNVTRFPSEHSRGGRMASTMRRFLEVIDDLELRDLPLQRGEDVVRLEEAFSVKEVVSALFDLSGNKLWGRMDTLSILAV
ncbi:hypothetical protein CK203_108894 [Vitis vinifera]|uniref:Endonuclease/exonuclease/phosphatase domain-containing protein n=1 Tax=Vitis vinifera TaxID=29760 RepID=A0A438CSB0_VITVI|nr:hypothetical protein CK203_108894 [Vitis vinifera]